ncbi:citrate lyase acyl carrier protein [Atopobacter sp. AH10]|uniref:citrate lyase acyl carrier protein n=1 Tax=Atopobacter sp. AH10 TaxID=2315861 RepID=UPI000EF1A768|nr:citrate lyase acyl carrier protein [Atopobacter sp. AH10]RLK62489.1 citrate lyase acyl carrier protein [Atopobacter sp. AH10]
MELKHSAIAGTLESSDCQVILEPGTNGIELTIQGDVIAQYGRQIKASVLETLEKLEVKDAVVSLQDQGALDCTIRSRVQTAVLRASDQKENLPWGVQI